MSESDPDSDFDGIHRAYGKAMVEWAGVEWWAYSFYAAMFEPANPHLISISWYSIQSFDSKIAMLDRCAIFILSDETYKNEWSPILKKVRKASQERNSIVHSSITSRIEDDYSISIYLSPAELDATAHLKRRLNNPAYEYDQNKLEALAARYDSLWREIRDFVSANFPHYKINFIY